MIARKIQNKESTRILKVLFDSGGSHTLISRAALPIGVTTQSIAGGQRACQTAAGNFQVTSTVRLRDCMLPEFDKTKRIHGVVAGIFDAPCKYDVVLGRDFLTNIGLIIDFDSQTVKWMDHKIPMRERDYWTESRVRETMFSLTDDPLDDEESFILDAKYESKTPKEIVATMKHLSAPQRERMEHVLGQFSELFDGKLGSYKGPQVHLEVDSNVLPTHSKAYSVPEIHKKAYLRELKHLVEIGVLRVCGPTEWAAPSFIIPKKDGRVRWLTDFRNLNKALKRKQYPLPLIHEIVSRRRGYKFFTKIDLTMMYYAFELDEYSKELCTIVTPFGKFQYNRLPMGLKISPDEAQFRIEQVLQGLDVEVYIDDVGIFSNTWEEHCTLVTQVLSRLQAAGLKVVPEKCEWAVQETDFLGHWLTPTGTKPWAKKVDAVLRMQRPQTLTQLRAFIGAVTYYRHMFPRRSHLLAPLTRLTGSTRFEWTPGLRQSIQRDEGLTRF